MDTDDIGVGSKEEAELDLLRTWLAMKRWNFELGSSSCADFAEGVCVLGGIDPERSFRGDEGRGWKLLPGSLRHYGFEKYPPWADAFQLDKAVERNLERISAIGLRGLVTVQNAIRTASRADREIPWLETANEDLECARFLPPEMRTKSEIIAQIKKIESRNAGRSRASKDEKSTFIQTKCRPIFDQLLEVGFPAQLCTRSGKPNASQIAARIYHQVADNWEKEGRKLPSETAIADSVRKWLTESKSKPAKN